MIRARNVTAALAIAALAALPACSKIDSMMGRSTGGTAASRAVAQPVANDMVRQVQARLQQDGYYKQGMVDGVWGAGTMNAVQAFQRDHSLDASGKLDVPTLQALNIADTGSNPSLTPTTGATGTTTTGTTGDLTRLPGSTTPNTANPTYTGPSTTSPTYTGPSANSPAYTAPGAMTPATRQP